MDKSALMALVVVLLVVLLALMVLGWRARLRRQASLPAPRRVEGDADVTRHSADAHYVATTIAGEPLNRVAVGGLGFRARASVSVSDGGVVLSIPGEHPIWIPANEIEGIDRATWTIDRVVERDGLVLLAWRLVGGADHSVAVDSYLRFDTSSDAAEFIAAVTAILASHTSPTTSASPQGGIA